MRLLAIDIGYINMGVASAVVDDSCDIHFHDVFRYNIVFMRHTIIPSCECTIPHTCETCDRVEHFIQENRDLFEDADCILIERQPPMGFKDIEALIMSKFRSKVKLVSPNKMHKHFHMNTMDYEERKVKVVEIATPMVAHIPTWISEVRKHDMADAVCMCIMYTDKLKEEQIKKEKLENMKRLPFEEFRRKK